eukprot:355203-Chlamydomonas_euryale.AAC.6
MHTQVAAEVLQDLVTVSRRPGANFEVRRGGLCRRVHLSTCARRTQAGSPHAPWQVCSVVTKPPEQDHAGAHVWRAAKKLDIAPGAILTPKSPKEVGTRQWAGTNRHPCARRRHCSTLLASAAGVHVHGHRRARQHDLAPLLASAAGVH